MSASIMEIGRMTNGTSLPLSQYEEPYGEVANTITIPFNVLWTEARAGITKILQFSFSNLEDILAQAEVELSDEELIINSRIISAAFGPSRSQVQFPESVTAELRHLERLSEGERSVCVWWDSRLTSWSQTGCHLVSSTSSQSQCQCDSLAPLAVMRTRGPAHSSQSSTVPIMTLQIVTYIVAAISVVCVVLILVKVSSLSSLSPPRHYWNFIAVPPQHPACSLQDSLPQSGGETRLQPSQSLLSQHGPQPGQELHCCHDSPGKMSPCCVVPSLSCLQRRGDSPAK